MKKIVLIASVAFLFVACKDKNRDVTLTQPGSINGQLNSTQANAGKTTNAQLPASNVITGAGINPPHGQPGHRCDIADGAPLPAATGNTALTPVPQVTTRETAVPTINQLPPNVSVVPGNTAKPSGNLNPAHGQPGHKCEIPVGAPLNSAPAAKTNNTIQNLDIKPVNNPIATPTAPGMNPQHGQPGHRCDISVGAPLNSAPSKVEEKKDSTKN